MFNKQKTLIIIDDIFPSIYSPFRYEEYIEYMKNLENVYVFTTGKSLEAVNEKRKISEVIAEFEEKNPEFKGKVLELNDENKVMLKKLKNKVAMITFLANVRENIGLLEEFDIPFAFTLYPGGGFVINDDNCESELRKICSSRNFEKVIVTQKNVYKYLINKKICDKSQVEFIYGVVTPSEILNNNDEEKKYYKKNKNNLDMCFVAHKYTEKGVDKGYDLFINAAKELNKKYSNIHYHVVGGFDKNDIEVEELKNKITFYGIKDSKWLKKFYKSIDIIISPNRPFKLGKGSFDGFPTGSCTEAMINGVLLMWTDELKLNIKFKNKRELLIIKPNVDDIIRKVEKLYKKPTKIIKIAKKGKIKAKKIYSKKYQIIPRINLLKEICDEREKNG